MKCIIHQRQIKAQYYPDFLFNLIGKGRDQAKYVKILHDFTNKVYISLKLFLVQTIHKKLQYSRTRVIATRIIAHHCLAPEFFSYTLHYERTRVIATRIIARPA